MAGDYKGLVVWQKAMQAAKEIYRVAPDLPREETYGLRSQLTRAAVSVPTNIAEGWARETPRDTGHFLAIAQGSLAETETILTLCEELGYLQPAQTETARNLLDEVGRMLAVKRRKRRET